MFLMSVLATVLGTAGPGAGGEGPGVRSLVVEVLPRMELGRALEVVGERMDVEVRPLVVDEKNKTGLDLNAMVGPIRVPRASELLLDAVLSEVEAPEWDRPTWQAGPSGSIRVGHRSRLNAFLTTRTYEIEDLLVVLPDFSETPMVRLGTARHKVGEPGFGPEEISLPLGEEQDAVTMSELVELIKTMVESECSADEGEKGPTIRVFESRLVIRAPGYVHRALNTIPE